MRTLALIAALAALNASAVAEARNFWQTYGATVASPEGCGAGCAWNANSDYFVPRQCDTGGYGLFSPCKTSHYLSPACRNLHPIYAGYCTPFGSCHYKWRDHVYKEHCGCTPLACTYGPWELDKCGKHCRMTPALDSGCGACGGSVLTAGGCGQAADGCGQAADGCGQAGDGCGQGCSECEAGGLAANLGGIPVGGALPNVEPLGGEILGVIEAYPAAMAGASRGGMGMPATMPGMMPGAAGGVIPGANPLPVQPLSTPAGNALMLPNIFGR